jgi:hypothetical protein
VTAPLLLLAGATAPLRVPVDLGREQAAELARAELADPAYHPPDQPLLQRALQWLIDRVSELVDRIGQAAPGGWLGVLGLVVLVVAAVAVVRWRMGPVGRTARGTTPLFSAATAATAAEHRRRSEAEAQAGRYAEAVRERLRAVVRELEERGVLEPRAGRTADEAAITAGTALPDVAPSLRAAAARFDEIWYGGREAGPGDYEQLVALDRAVAAARPPSMTGPVR